MGRGLLFVFVGGDSMKIHEIKLYSCYFDDVLSGKKSFELRKNDRDYYEGDYLILKEIDNEGLTGRQLKVEVSYLLQDYDGLLDGYCILGIKLDF